MEDGTVLNSAVDIPQGDGLGWTRKPRTPTGTLLAADQFGLLKGRQNATNDHRIGIELVGDVVRCLQGIGLGCKKNERVDPGSEASIDGHAEKLPQLVQISTRVSSSKLRRGTYLLVMRRAMCAEHRQQHATIMDCIEDCVEPVDIPLELQA